LSKSGDQNTPVNCQCDRHESEILTRWSWLDHCSQLSKSGDQNTPVNCQCDRHESEIL